MAVNDQRRTGPRPHWWRNVPLPEAHLIASGMAALLQLIVPLRIPVARRTAFAAGWPVVALAVALSAWAVGSASRAGVTVDRTDGLVRHGAFGVSRNPMYIAWSAGLIGIAMLTRSPWLLLGAVVASAVVHRDVLREEVVLERKFGEEYRAYRAATPRYF
jgi:protein-S-isoprenylcysteine O-methyltransferase Ste14